MRGETKSLVAMSLLASPLLTSRTTSSSLGGERCPAARGSFAFAAGALRVGDGFLGGSRRVLSLRGVKVLLTHRISQRRDRGLVADLVDDDPDHADALPDGLGRATAFHCLPPTDGLGCSAVSQPAGGGSWPG